MSRETLIMLLGLLTALAPFVGLPYPFLMVLLPILGLAVAGSALALSLRKKDGREPEHEAKEA